MWACSLAYGSTTRFSSNFVQTGCTRLDESLGGGFPRGGISLLYGQAGAGKTSLAVQSAVLSCRRGEKVLYIDAGGGFTSERLVQTAGRWLPEIMENLVFFTPHTFQELMILVEAMDRYVRRNTVALTIDTVTAFYRLGLSNVQQTFTSNRQLNRLMAYLRQLAVAHAIAVIVVSDVRTPIAAFPSKPLPGVEPVARRVLNYWSTVSVRLSVTAKPGLKEWVVEKGSDLEGARSLLLVSSTGVSDSYGATATYSH